MFYDSRMTSAMRRMLKARAAIAQSQVFFASTIYGVRLTETRDSNPTMRTNGIEIQFNPKWVAQNDSFIEGVLLHENLHCAFNHAGRRHDRIPIIWNAACDFSINLLIAHYFRLPPGALLDRRFNGMNPERIYEILLREYQDNCPQGSGPMFEPKDPQEIKEYWDRQCHLAIDRANKAGMMQGELKKVIEAHFSNDILDWHSIIRDMARDAREDSYRSWSYPNRRFLAYGIYLPGAGINKINKLVLCLDISGSISSRPDVIKEMKAEGMSLLEQQLVNEIVMIATDTRVTSKAVATTPDEVDKFDLGRFGGGTHFDAAMAEIAKHANEVMGCVFFTDMETRSFGTDPKIPVVWVNWNKNGIQAPYGRTCVFSK